MGTYEPERYNVREVSRTVHVEDSGESPTASVEPEAPVHGTEHHTLKQLRCNIHGVDPFECFPAHWPQAFSGRAQSWDLAPRVE